MNRDYFNGCDTPEEMKERYRVLAKQFHPDRGGNAEDFRELKAQYEKRLQELAAKASAAGDLERWGEFAALLSDAVKLAFPALFEKAQGFLNTLPMRDLMAAAPPAAQTILGGLFRNVKGK